ncbi:hypothetical protein DXG01_002655 [Tephrocybe rancida]|nr:hypothetical protein DXG01_002655 [Tephrocybe rancida]
MFGDSEDSDLTDLSSDSESDRPLASLPRAITVKAPPPKPKVDKKEKKSETARLTEPHQATAPIESIYNEVKQNTIDLNAEYQRCVVWCDTKQGFLIDSLMHNYVVFPLVFAERPGEDGVKIKVCIDGKQRITAIQQFMDGEISYRDSQLNRDMWYKKVPAGKRGLPFTPGQRQRFAQTMIPTCRYKDIDEHDEREIFQRVQNGVALAPNERLRAINGINGDLVRAMHRQASQGLRDYLGWEKSKGRDFFMLGQLAVMLKEFQEKSACLTSEVKLARLETFLKTKEKKAIATPETRDAALGVIDIFNLIHDSPQLMDCLSSIQSQCFVLAGVMIHMYRTKYSPAQLADIIRKMRASLKPGTTAKMYKDLVAFVTKEVPNLSLKGKGLGNLPTPSALTTAPVPAPVPEKVSAPIASSSTRRATTLTTPKRKRNANKLDSDDADYFPELTKKRRRTTKLVLSDSEDDDDDDDSRPVVKDSLPVRTTIPRPIAGAVGDKGLSKATTKIKRPASKVAATATATKDMNQTQIAKPSVKPTRSKNPTTTGTVPTPSTDNRGITTQRKFAPPTKTSHMPTPPSSTTNASLTPAPSTSLPSASASAPLPTPTSRQGSRMSTPALGTLRMDNIKAEPRQSPPMLTFTPPPSSSTSRLAPLHAARMRINQTASGSLEGSGIIDPHRQHHTQLLPPVDPEANLQSQLDHILISSLSPTSAIVAPRVPSPLSPKQPMAPRPSTVSVDADVIMADGRADQGLLDHAIPFQRAVKGGRGVSPSQYKRSNQAVPPIDTGTNVDGLRSTSTLTSVVKQGLPTPQSTSAVASTPEQSFSVRSMPPIRKFASHPGPSRTLPLISAKTGKVISAARRPSTPRSGSGLFRDDHEAGHNQSSYHDGARGRPRRE